VLTALGVVALLLLLENTAAILGVAALEGLLHHEQFALLMGGAGLLVWGLGGGGMPQDVRHILRRMTPGQWGEVALVLVVTLLGAAVRRYQLEDGFRFFVDELNFADVLALFANFDDFSILVPLVRGFPGTYSYLQFLSVETFGYDLGGLRTVSVIFGTLTIPATYLLARFLTDRPTAIITLLLIATFPPHVHFSRLGLNNIADPLFGTLALAALAGGMRYHLRVLFALGGVALGLTQYFYEVGRIFYPLIVLLWCGWGLVSGFARPHWRSLLLAGGLAVMVAVPVYASYWVNDASIIPRATNQAELDTSEDVPSVLERVRLESDYLSELSESLRVYVNVTEGRFPYYGGEYGYVLPPLWPLLFAGVVAVALRVRRAWSVLLLGPVLLSFATSLIVTNEVAARYVLTFPLLTVLLAVGVHVVVGLVQRWVEQAGPALRAAQTTPRPYAIAGGMLLAVVLATGQAVYYHTTHLDTFNTQFRQAWTYDGQDVIFRASDLQPPPKVHLLTTETVDVFALQGILDFLQPDNLGLTAWNRNIFNVWDLPRAEQHVFFVPHDDAELLALLRWNFVLSGPQPSPDADRIPDAHETLMLTALQPRQGPLLPPYAVDTPAEYPQAAVLRGWWCAFDPLTWDLGRAVCVEPLRARGVFGARAWAEALQATRG